MKKALKYFGVLLFATVYCFAVGRVSTSDVTYLALKTEKGKHITSVSTDLFSGLVSSYRNSSPSHSLKNPDLKDSLSGPWILEKTHKAVFISKYSQYVSSAKNLLIRHRKADIIFPFHYFW
ncbi:hypothetical protein [uncultured Arcticibacterium sp.]|uniref:hypothetical protein n=1 Tax=uncultured Arcticibacterium sp. TaxID=2173042 RepID=UPI0030F5771F